MYVFKNNDVVPWDKCVATVGFFDGVHAGHRFLISELKKQAEKEQSLSVVFTFNVHPRKILHSDYQPKLLTTLNEKLEQFETTGIDACVVLDFTPELANLSASQFIEEVLAKQYHVKTLFVGHDHRFGHNREENVDDYKRYGEKVEMKVTQAEKFTTADTTHLSSSEIRKALQNGNITRANQLLTYPYTVTGHVIKGNQIGRNIGFPTANIILDDKNKIIPSVGVYAVKVFYNGKTYKGMMNIGYRPTIQDDKVMKMEVNIIDFNENIYNETIKIAFIHYIREERKFKNLDELHMQLQNDRDFVLKMG